MKEFVFEADKGRIPDALDFIREKLNEKKTNRKNLVKSLLAAEEILGKICEVAEEGTDVIVGISGLFSDLKIKYSAKGGEFTVADIEQKLLFSGETATDDRANEAMGGLLEKLFGSNLNIRCEKGRISVTQQVEKSPYKSLIVTITALILGILCGLFIQKYASEEVATFMTKSIFVPIYTVLINSLKMVVAPLVFFAIGNSIASFSDIKALGRIALKIVGIYVFTSVLAICVGLFTYTLFPIGNTGLAAAVDAEAAVETIAKGESATISIKDTLVGIVPTDIITPFQTSNMLQIIFMAVCLGLATAALTKAVPAAKDFVNAMDKVFSKITEVIVSFMPVLVFCAMAKMMATMDLSSFIHVIKWIPVVYFGDVLMVVVYLLLLFFVGLNPFKFIGKYYPAMIAAYTLSSSNAALPSSIRQCKKLGVSEKIYSFSLPLGATINMDGSCITLIISALFFAKIYGLPTTSTMLVQLFIAIIVLSVGSPGVPGGNLVCLTLLIPQIGVPAEAISLVIGLYPLISMMQTMANVTGDAVVTTIVAKSEKMIDTNTYNS